MIIGSAKYIAKLKEGIKKFHCEENPERHKHDWETADVVNDDFPDGAVGCMWTIRLKCKSCGEEKTRRQWGFI